MSKTATPDTVLVIDDNADFCELVNVIGQVAGVPVLTAPNCRTGLKVLSEQKGKIKLILRGKETLWLKKHSYLHRGLSS